MPEEAGLDMPAVALFIELLFKVNQDRQEMLAYEDQRTVLA